jgi:hypothetical protein
VAPVINHAVAAELINVRSVRLCRPVRGLRVSGDVELE